MFKKASRSKNFRRKVETTDEEDPSRVNQAEEEIVIKKTNTSSKKKKTFGNKRVTPTTLSFDDEDGGDEEAFQIKKDKASLRKFAPRLPIDTTMEDVQNESSASSYYDKDALEKLRAGTPSLPASVKSSISTQQEQTKDKIDNDTLLYEKFSSTMNATLPGMGGIPDASAILAAKKKREQLRKGISITEADDGFIPLDENETVDSGSRLVREEDEIGDDGGADFEKYVGDNLNLNKLSAKSREKDRLDGARQMIDEAEAENDENRSEDMDRWEADMMKFGGVKPTLNEHDPFKPPVNYRPAVIPQPCDLSSLSDIMRTLNVEEGDRETAIRQSEINAAETRKAIGNAEIVDSDLDKEIERSSRRYNYFQELVQYVNDLGELLDTKYPDLETLEDEVHDTIYAKTETAMSRRYQLNLDDLCTFTNIKLDEHITE